jgi:hypothetical protein
LEKHKENVIDLMKGEEVERVGSGNPDPGRRYGGRS